MDKLDARMQMLELRMDTMETKMNSLECRIGRIERKMDGVESNLLAFSLIVNERFNKANAHLVQIDARSLATASELEKVVNWVRFNTPGFGECA